MMVWQLLVVDWTVMQEQQTGEMMADLVQQAYRPPTEDEDERLTGLKTELRAGQQTVLGLQAVLRG